MAALHPQLRKRAREWLESLQIEIGDTRIGDRFNGRLDSFGELLLQTPPWRDLLTFGDLLDITSRIDAFKDRIPGLYEGPLTGVEGLIDEIEKDFVRFLESLPRRYFVCIELPGMALYGVPKTRVVNGIDLLQTMKGFDEQTLLPSGVAPTFDALMAQPARLIRDTTYLCLAVDGYASSSPQSYSVARALGRLKHFVFMSLSERGLRKRGLDDILAIPNFRAPQVNVDGLVHCPDDANDAHRVFIDEALADFLRWIRLDESDLNVHDEKGKSALAFRPATTGEEKLIAFTAKLHLTNRFFDLAPDAPDAERIRAAMEWWVDAESADNNTIAFLQACIGLEALLGDADDRSRVKDKLSDRYSYLLGKTFSEREDLKERFMKMYDHRSTLVHGRRARLASNDLIAMVQSKEMLSKSIRAEVRNLLRRVREREGAAAKK